MKDWFRLIQSKEYYYNLTWSTDNFEKDGKISVWYGKNLFFAYSVANKFLFQNKEN